MAHVTLQLIWYRLGETRENMEELYQQALAWYSEFSFKKVDVIDFLFVFWIVFGLIVAALAQFYNRVFSSNKNQTITQTLFSTPKKRKPVGPIESCQWLNSVINWVYLNYNSTPEYVNAWICGLNEQARRIQGVEVHFDRILAGSLPPRITNINTDPGPRENFRQNPQTVHGSLEASELGLQIQVSEQTVTSQSHSVTSHPLSCDVNVQLLRGELNVQAVLQREEVHVFVRFEGEPEIVLLIKPHPKLESDPQTRKELESRVNVGLLDKALKQCLSQAVTHFVLHTAQFDKDTQAQLLNHFGNSSNHVPPTNEKKEAVTKRKHDVTSRKDDVTNRNYVIETPLIIPERTGVTKSEQQYPAFLSRKFEQKIVNSSLNASRSSYNENETYMTPGRGRDPLILPVKTAFRNSGQKTSPDSPVENGAARIGKRKKLSLDLCDPMLGAPPKPPRTPERLFRQDQRLLVKVIKASGLGAKDMGCNDPYCTVEMDDPNQRHTTSVVRNAVNPFWDEAFLFDASTSSRELLFEVFDSDKAPGEDFLGMAAVNVEELRKQPSSRHIIPLAGRQPGTGKGGNITVEFLFMDPAEGSVPLQQEERDLMMATAANLSPRRRVETQRTVTPSGLILTTQTTTLDHGNGDAGDDRSARSPTDSSPRSRRAGKSATMPSRMTQSTPTDEHDGRVSSTSSDRSERQRNKPKRSSSLASTLRKRFNKVRKPRSHSADRMGADEDGHLRPPEQYPSGSRATEDIDHVQIPGQNQTNLKKSRSLGSSLRKLFKGKKKKGERSRESSQTRGQSGAAPDRLTPDKPPSTAADRASTVDTGSYQQSPSPQPRRNQRMSASSVV